MKNTKYKRGEKKREARPKVEFEISRVVKR